MSIVFILSLVLSLFQVNLTPKPMLSIMKADGSFRKSTVTFF